jgi:hypothetical protein
MTTDIPDLDVYCIGVGCMPCCDDCKWRARWDVVGELPAVERNARYPGIHRLNEELCQLTSGRLFAAKEQSA